MGITSVCFKEIFTGLCRGLGFRLPARVLQESFSGSSGLFKGPG